MQVRRLSQEGRITGPSPTFGPAASSCTLFFTGWLPFDDNVRVLLDKVRDGRFVMPHDINPMAKDVKKRFEVRDLSLQIED